MGAVCWCQHHHSVAPDGRHSALGRRIAPREEITWGIFSVSEEAAGRPLDDVEGLDVVELGCGTAYVSAWLARRLQARTGLDFPLIEAPGERVPLLDGSADLVVSEYGASLWADPDRWISESARLLRPRGRRVMDRSRAAEMWVSRLGG